jgi:glutamine amidotransferase-like uncharacterized protein
VSDENTTMRSGGVFYVLGAGQYFGQHLVNKLQ